MEFFLKTYSTFILFGEIKVFRAFLAGFKFSKYINIT